MGQTQNNQLEDLDNHLSRNFYQQISLTDSHVSLLKNRTHPQQVYLMKKLSTTSKEDYHQILQKIKKQKQLKHDHYLSLHQFYTKSQTTFCSTFYQISLIYQHSLHNLQIQIEVRKNQNRIFTQKQIWSILCSLSLVLAYLHRKNVHYVTLNPEDIYLTNQGVIKLSDPQICSQIIPQFIKINKYYSPQLLPNPSIIGQLNIYQKEKNIVFSLGMCILQMLSMNSLSDCYDYINMVIDEKCLLNKFKNLNESTNNKSTNAYSNLLVNLIQKMVRIKCDERLCITQLEMILFKLVQGESFEGQLKKQLGNTISFNNSDPSLDFLKNNGSIQYIDEVIPISALKQRDQQKMKLEHKYVKQEQQIKQFQQNQLQSNDQIRIATKSGVLYGSFPQIQEQKMQQLIIPPELDIEQADESSQQEQQNQIQNNINHYDKQQNYRSNRFHQNNIQLNNYKTNKITTSIQINPLLENNYQTNKIGNTTTAGTNQYGSSITHQQSSHQQQSNFNPISHNLIKSNHHYMLQTRLPGEYSNQNKQQKYINQDVYTDPKLLQMLKKDIQTIHLKRSQQKNGVYNKGAIIKSQGEQLYKNLNNTYFMDNKRVVVTLGEQNRQQQNENVKQMNKRNILGIFDYSYKTVESKEHSEERIENKIVIDKSDNIKQISSFQATSNPNGNNYKQNEYQKMSNLGKENVYSAMNYNPNINSFKKNKAATNIKKQRNPANKIDKNISSVHPNRSQTNSRLKFTTEVLPRGRYQGQKRENLRHGFGTFYYKEGGKYTGYWVNNKMQGKGTLYYPNNKKAYEGEWKEDKLQGWGILYNEDAKQIGNNEYYRNFDNIQDYWVRYEGEFKGDCKWGNGVFELTNGERFEGRFEGDVACGQGIYYKNGGQKIRGLWKNNRLIKQF